MPSAQCLFFPPFHLDLTTEALWYGSQRLPLRPKAWALLRYLVENPQRLITQAELLEAIWQREYLSDGLLRGSIRELRRVLQDEATASRFIETVSGRGYRFIAAVSTMPPPLPVPEVPPQPPRSALPAPAAPQSSPTTVVLVEEYKLVTILCGALAEAPALAARLGPERWYRLLQTVVGLVQEVVQSYAGTLTLTTSEGFTAVFGAPVAQEDHARRAVLAALDLRQRMHASPTLHAQLAGGVLACSLAPVAGRATGGGRDPPGRDLSARVSPTLGRARGGDGRWPCPHCGSRTAGPWCRRCWAQRSCQRRACGRCLPRRGEILSFWRSWPGMPWYTTSQTPRVRCPRRYRRCWPRGWIGYPWRPNGCSRSRRCSGWTWPSRSCRPAEQPRYSQQNLRTSRRRSSSMRPTCSPSRVHLQAALTQEVAYNSLLQERRRVLHARIVEAFETLAPERVAEQVERLAHHALRGEVWDKAVTYCQQAGTRAYDRAAFHEAVAAFEQALRPSRTCPSTTTPGGGPSISASRWEACWARWERMGGASPCWARPRPGPGRSTTGSGWDRCWPGWPRDVG